MRRAGGAGGFWGGAGILIAVGLVLSIRAGQAVRIVLGSGVPFAAGVSASLDPEVPGVREIVRRDSLLAACREAARDPFREASPQPLLQADGVSRGPARAGRPAVRALLFDSVSPSVQLSVESATSGWLHAGESFGGWTIVEIGPAAVRVARAGENLTIPSP